MIKAPSRFAAKLIGRCWFSVKSDRYSLCNKAVTAM